MDYLILLDGEQHGPYSGPQLVEMWRIGRITQKALVWYEGLTEWIPYSMIHDELLPPSPAAAAVAVTAGTALARKSEKRILPALVLWFLFGGVGAHAWYAGAFGEGIIYGAMWIVLVMGLVYDAPVVWLICAAVIGLLAFVDLIRLIVGAYKDGRGLRITSWT